MSGTLVAIRNIEQSQLGFVEGANNDNPYGVALGYANHQAYCDQGQSWVFWRAGALGLIGGKHQNCQAHLNWFKAHGLYYGVPKIGDLIFFDWNFDGIADHVGWVESTAKTWVQTIEFNTRISTAPGARQGVARRRRSRTYQVMGYGRPHYDTGVISVTPVNYLSHAPHDVPLVIDGIWGPLTTQRLQQFLRVDMDGLRGPLTTRALQAWVGCRQDGSMGPVTIQHLQRKLGVLQDGILGPVTVKALQRYLNRH